jgi:A/G-specific adenine glycosylase
MLQQTQAGRVVAYFDRFLERFPTVAALAASPLADVVAAWSGLGYNSRAKRLRDAARIVVDTGWPETPEGLADLPGVGPYTAAAVASLAFGVRVPAVDTNLRRVLSRWEGTPLSGAVLHEAAREALGDPAADWNQAMMDLGASLCRPRDPRCPECPVASWCSGPTVYEPPPRQAVFAGSIRQVRGSVLRALVAGPASVAALAARTGHAPERLATALSALVDEGLVEAEQSGYRIAR